MAPVIIEAADGAGTVTLQGDANIADCRHLYFYGVQFVSGGEPFHCERCVNLLLKGCEPAASRRRVRSRCLLRPGRRSVAAAAWHAHACVAILPTCMHCACAPNLALAG